MVYGRNDNYGYNLPKRVALSLNNFAELLDAPGDEIIFVDYNSPNSSPTFPEAIADTLTERAKSLLRVIRVRPHQIPLGALNPKLKTNEPLARNVGFRRSNPENRWILSTNTDMLFLTKSDVSLSGIASSLDDGQYGLPRFEIPETVWESLPRSDPGYVIRELDGLAARLSLRHIVTVDPPHIFDGPGDFQLFLRADLFSIGGADEDMTKGWHVDSNLAKRVSFLRGNVVSLLDRLEGYHCDHTKQVTPAHKAGAESNSLLTKVKLVSQSTVERQKDTWGLHMMQLEEIRLPRGKSVVTVDNLVSAVSARQDSYSHSDYNAKGWDLNTIPPGHVLPFLVDFFVHYPRGQGITWVGPDTEVRRRALRLFELMGFKIDLYPREVTLEQFSLARQRRNDSARRRDQIVIFDFSLWSFGAGNEIRTLTRAMERDLRVLARTGNARIVSHVIGINVVGNSVESTFGEFVASSSIPFSIGLRHGELLGSDSPELSNLRTRVIKKSVSAMKNFLRKSRRGLQLAQSGTFYFLAVITGLRVARRLREFGGVRPPH